MNIKPKFDPTVTQGNILTIATIIVAAVAGIAKVEVTVEYNAKRIEKLEQMQQMFIENQAQISKSLDRTTYILETHIKHP